MRPRRILGALMVAALLGGCGGAADMSQQRREAGIPDCSQVSSESTSKTSGTAAEGQPIPEVALQCLGGGETVSLGKASSKGVTVVTVWASWCRPCRSEAPLLADAYRRYRDRVTFLGVDYAESDPSEAISFAGEAGLTFPHLQDPDSTIRGAWQVNGVPVTFIITDGTIVTRHSGGWRSQQQLDSAIDQAIQAIERTS
ncbi:TlpA disulfide reductase family protein [Cutibacterium sp.]|uniref:TlpA family protein disulfide reductase n=1 Tax=Cutibacterium sp. TaxID=1912221 RepID=UPI0026DCCEC5|nr:TlpA disulfide reductase family protein [Cutibacterium sp.]MDO4412717.1 TlpA disulfide reductase family protein [Cutibacterium sp.]